MNGEQDGTAMTLSERKMRFRRLYEEHFRLVWSLVGHYGLAGAQREDAVQEVWLAAFRRLHTLRSSASARAWLCAITRKTAWRQRRTDHRQARREAALASEPEPRSSDPERRLDAATTVEAALCALSQPQRQVLVLAHCHGLTAPEISQGLGLPLNTVYSRLRLARRRLGDFETTHLETELERAGLDPRPPASVRARMLAALLPQLGLPAAAAATTGATAGLKLVGFAVASLTIATTVAVWPDASAGDRAAPTVTPVATIEPATSEPTPAPVAIPTETPVPLEAPVTAPPTVSPVSDEPRVAPKKPPQRPTPPTVEEPGTDDLDAELALLQRAQRALRDDDPDEALQLLRRHERSHPGSRLADVRRGAMVRTLCALDRPEDARRQAARLQRDDPQSPVAVAIQDVCKESAG